ncbi:hypothetical protein ACFS4T_19010 [Pseudomonas lini]
MPLKLEAVSLHESYRNTARLLWIDLEFDHQMRRLSPNETQVIHSAKISGPLSFFIPWAATQNADRGNDHRTGQPVHFG